MSTATLPTLPSPAPLELQQFALTPEARERIENALAAAAIIGKVATVQQQENAVAAQRSLKQLVNDIEKVRKQLTEPALAFQRQVMAAAKEATTPLETEYGRLSDLIADFAMQERRRAQEAQEKIERERREAEAKARKEAEEKERAIREQAERERIAAELEAKRKQEEFAKSPEGLAQAEAFRLKQQQEAKEREARQAEQLRRIQEQEEARIRAERERAALQAQAHAPQKAAGQVVREEWEITISNPHALAVAHPDCVKIEPRLQVIKAKLDAGMQLPGVSAYKRATSGVRAGRTIEV